MAIHFSILAWEFHGQRSLSSPTPWDPLSDFHFHFSHLHTVAFLMAPVNAGDVDSIDPWVMKVPWRKKWQPTPAVLSGEFHGQRSLRTHLWSRKSVRHNLVTKQQRLNTTKQNCSLKLILTLCLCNSE